MTRELRRTSARNCAVTLIGSGAVAGALLLAGCTTLAPIETRPETTFEHIHELAVDPSDGTLLVATHEGLFRLTVEPDGASGIEGPLGGLDFDPMGFTIADGIAYASGHPGPTTPDTFGKPNLGLITSTDGSQTWTNVSLTGVTDFHALTVNTGENQSAQVFGYDASAGQLQRSIDGGLTWTAGAEMDARDILADGTKLYATTPDGLAISDDDGTTFVVDSAAPDLVLVDADTDGDLAGVDVTGTIWTRQSDQTWIHHPTIDGSPQALVIQDSRIWVADDRGIAYTDDFGDTWTVLSLGVVGAAPPEASSSLKLNQPEGLNRMPETTP